MTWDKPNFRESPRLDKNNATLPHARLSKTTDQSFWFSLHALSSFIPRLFMQPAPSEAPQHVTSADHSQYPPSTLQHGSPDNADQASGRARPGADDREPSPDLVDADAASIASNGSRRGRRAHAGWLSSRSNSSQEGSPGHRIEEYERAHKALRKPSIGVVFQVIPSAKDAQDKISVEEFPNGQNRLINRSCIC